MKRVLKVPSIVIYHSPCNDGFGAAYVAWKYCQINKLDEPEFWPVTHTDKLDIKALENQDVLMVDIAFGRETMVEIHDKASSFLCLDHHKTAQETLQDLDFAEFDMTQSGVMLAWKYFFPDKKMPEFLYWIGLRDLWLHKKQDNVNALLFTTAFEPVYKFTYWDLFFDSEQLIEEHLQRGYDQYYKHNAAVEDLAKSAQPAKWGSVHIMSFHIAFDGWFKYVSDLGNFLTKDDPELVAFMWHYREKEQDYKVSLRSTGFDVGTLAQTMGGGGHARAAGFTMKEMPTSLLK